MANYWVKTPCWLKRFFPKELIWKMPVEDELKVYLTFDDGPHPKATPYILEQLEQHGGKATFFCIGKNVTAYPDIFKQLTEQGHTVGNHTHNHINGWKSSNIVYLRNILKAAHLIDSHSFRPPYGRIKTSQVRKLNHRHPAWKIYMWDVLSADFDTGITPEKCLENVINHIEPGSIVVFHDSEKAWERMSYALPRVLQYCKEKNWKVAALPKY